jgi:hypothetical protein
MDAEFGKWLTSLGVGGVLAGGMFWVYRKDALAAQQRIAELTEHLMRLAEQIHTVMGQNQALAQTLLARIDAQLSDKK